jgi:hypothetical protein
MLLSHHGKEIWEAAYELFLGWFQPDGRNIGTFTLKTRSDVLERHGRTECHARYSLVCECIYIYRRNWKVGTIWRRSGSFLGYVYSKIYVLGPQIHRFFSRERGGLKRLDTT